MWTLQLIQLKTVSLILIKIENSVEQLEGASLIKAWLIDDRLGIYDN